MPSSAEPVPNLHVTTSALSTVTADLIVIPVPEEDDTDGDLVSGSKTLAGALEMARRSGELRGRLFEMLVERLPDWTTPRVLLIGAGKRDEMSVERARRIASAAGLAARRHRAPHVAFAVGGVVP